MPALSVTHHLLGIVEGDYPEGVAPYVGGVVRLEGEDILVMTCRAHGPVSVTLRVAADVPGLRDAQVAVAFDWAPRLDRAWVRGGIDSAERAPVPDGWMPGRRYRAFLLGFGREGWDSVRDDDGERYELHLLPTETSSPPEILRRDDVARVLDRGATAS